MMYLGFCTYLVSSDTYDSDGLGHSTKERVYLGDEGYKINTASLNEAASSFYKESQVPVLTRPRHDGPTPICHIGLAPKHLYVDFRNLTRSTTNAALSYAN
jgi:hypothetical protein